MINVEHLNQAREDLQSGSHTARVRALNWIQEKRMDIFMAYCDQLDRAAAAKALQAEAERQATERATDSDGPAIEVIPPRKSPRRPPPERR